MDRPAGYAAGAAPRALAVSRNGRRRKPLKIEKKWPRLGELRKKPTVAGRRRGRTPPESAPGPWSRNGPARPPAMLQRNGSHASRPPRRSSGKVCRRAMPDIQSLRY
jgi:hypothetical protein